MSDFDLGNRLALRQDEAAEVLRTSVKPLRNLTTFVIEHEVGV